MGYLQRAADIRLKLYDYNKNPSERLWQQIQRDVQQYFELRKELPAQTKTRQKEKEREPSAITLSYLRKAFWITFALSLVVLITWLYFDVANYNISLDILLEILLSS